MGIHVPQRHLNHMGSLKGSIDLATLSHKQKKNIKKYFVEYDFGNYQESMTKVIARQLWDDHVSKIHPHVKGNGVCNYQTNHPIWKDIQSYLTMTLLLSSDRYISQEHIRKQYDNALEQVDNILSQDEVTTIEYFEVPSYGHHALNDWNMSVEQRKQAKEEVASIEALYKKIKYNNLVPLPDDNEGLKMADGIINGDIKFFDVEYRD